MLQTLVEVIVLHLLTGLAPLNAANCWFWVAKALRPHTMLVSKPLEATSMRSHTISEPVAARHNTCSPREDPGGPLGALGWPLCRLGAEIGALRA